jgi:protein SCO1/2
MTEKTHPTRSMRHILLAATGLLAAVLVSAATWTAFRYRIERPGPELPVLGSVPEFALTASSGRPVSQASLAGSVWVADFIFTTCPGMCPVLSAQMARVQQALGQNAGSAVRLVSFSVDPQTDTPEVLRTYAQRFGADPQRWWFLTGQRDALYALIQNGFHLAVAGRSDNSDNEGLITHSDRFVLIDRKLQIRGYYHGMDDDDVQRLLHDVETLQREGS